MFLMIAFGAAFGYTVMARMSLLIGRLTDLIEFTDPSYGRRASALGFDRTHLGGDGSPCQQQTAESRGIGSSGLSVCLVCLVFG